MDKDIFPNANLVDCIRQACINLHIHPNDDDILNFLKQTMKNLKKEISIFELNELLAAITDCFLYNSKFFISFYPHLFKRSRLNSNFIIINIFIISDYIYMQSKLSISEYQQFIDDALTEISPQIQQREDIPLEIFGHKISPCFKKDIIFGLLLTSTLTDKIFSSTFTYLFQYDLLSENPKYTLLLQNFSKTCTIHISTQNEESNEQLNEFIKQNGDCLLTSMNEKAVSLIESVVIFIKSQEKKKIKGLKKDTILQFLAVLIIIMKKCKIQEKVTFSAKVILDLIIEGIKNLELNTFNVLNTSIDLIIENYFYIIKTFSIPFDLILKIFENILQQILNNKYNANKAVFLKTIFVLSEKDDIENSEDQINNFLNKNSQKLFELIFSDAYFDEINYNPDFKLNKLNLKHINQEIIINNYFSYDENIYPIIRFLHYSCYNISKNEFDKISDKLQLYIESKSKEKEWDEVLLICQFILNNKLNFDTEKAKSLFPPLINKILFGYNINDVNTIDEFLDIVLNDINLENNNDLFNILFIKMIEKDKNLLNIYLIYLFGKNINSYSYEATEFLKLYINEYEKYHSDFIQICKRMFIFKPICCRLIPQFDFLIEDFNLTSSFGLSFINKLYNTIENKNNNFQSFICLMNIACCFPILFTRDINRIFNVVYPTFDNILLLFDKKTDDDNLLLIKTVFSALHFFASTFLSSTIIDYFYEWLFANISVLSDGQILCSFIILNMLNKSENIETVSMVYILKYNFIETAINLLKREIKGSVLFKNCYKDNIYKFISSIYSRFSKMDSYTIIQINELMKIDNPIYYYFNKILFKAPDVHKFLIHIAELDYKTQLGKFHEKLARDNSFCLTYNFFMRKTKTPSVSQTRVFLNELVKDETNFKYDDLLTLKRPLTYRMVKYLIIRPFCFYNDILYDQRFYLIDPVFQYFNKIINLLNQMKLNGETNPQNEEDSDISFFSKDNFLAHYYHKNELINAILTDISLLSINNDCIFFISNILDTYIANDESLKLFLSFVSVKIKEKYIKCFSFPSFINLKVIYNLMKVLVKLSNKTVINKHFFNLCGNDLIDIALSPQFRKDPIMIKKVVKIFIKFDELPARLVQLIPFMIFVKNEKVTTLASFLYKKFSDDQLQCVNKIILDAFDNEISNEKRFSTLMNYITIFPSIIKMRQSKAYLILKWLLKKFETQKTNKIINSISLLLSELAPSRKEIGKISSENNKISKIPSFVKESSPEFWNFFEKHMDPIIELVTKTPSLIYKFEFLLDYPELIRLDVRISLFRQRMKPKINKSEKCVLNINPNQILISSYQSIVNKEPYDFLKEIMVVFEGTGAIDMGGPKREWFTKLAKEIFNKNYALFECSKSFCYQPSSISYVHEDYLKHFRFVGMFIARALIEGQCIDAHFTTSFCKQILHREPNLNDLQDVDEELFNSLNWMLENDVDPLDLYFEVDYEEFGVHKTMPLKENGSEIQVTNENKREFIYLRKQFTLSKLIENQLNAFCEGFYSLIPLKDIKFFSPYELDFLICGVPNIDVYDFIKHCSFNINNPAIPRFFNIIKRWDNEKLVKLFCFITGSSRIPPNGLKEFCEISGYPIQIGDGNVNGLPMAHTCFNKLDLPPYKSEREMEEKLLYAIQECDSFGMA